MKKKTPDHKKLVAIENSLIPAFAVRSKRDKRLLSYCVAQLNPVAEKEFGEITFEIKDFAKVYDLPLTYVYQELRDSIDSLNSQSFKRYEKGVHSTDTWIFWSKYAEYSGIVTIQLNPRLTPLLLDLKEKQYIQFALAETKHFTNKGWTLYVILKQWVKAGTQDFELGELKTLMGMPGKYKRWAEFSRQVIVPSVENINNVSDLKVKYVTMKRGRAIRGLSFTISRKKLGAPQADIDVDRPEQQIHAILIMGGLHGNTIDNFIETAKKHNKLHEFLKKAEGLQQKHKRKTKAITGSLNSFVAGWGQLPLFEVPVEKAAPRTFDSSAIRKCIADKRGCEIRKTKQPRTEMCQDCLEIYPLED